MVKQGLIDKDDKPMASAVTKQVKIGCAFSQCTRHLPDFWFDLPHLHLAPAAAGPFSMVETSW
ncbi:hypothetical protein ATY81_20825 [Rhizobium sp. R72]|nr:hypothetical protein ATY79_12480 [Rhizobium sp. R693]OWW02998.1 hypothetical protein ATY81_20825 [Rhizobium sp. R72]OWW03180.1 hypothetical protein ATY80_20825 [Rhizobium sp. R711]